MLVTGLFAGIGGFERAFAQIGFETELLVEIDPMAQAVLRTRFPQIPVAADVLELRGLPASTAILTAGFPCQNLSMAGDKSGIEGSKSRIVTKMFDLIAGSRVPIVVIENVYFMLQLDSGRAMQWLVERFEELGYHWAYRVLDSIGFGVPQRRRRVYMVASNRMDPRTVLFADETPASIAPEANLGKPLGFYWTEGRSGVGFTVDGIPPLKVGSALGIASPPAVLFPDGEVLLPSLEVCEQLQGFPVGWTDTPTDVGRGRGGSRWRMVGNAVTVPVARWVAERLKTPGRVLDFDLTPFDGRRRWPDAAWSTGNGRVGVFTGDKPVSIPVRSIADFRDATWTRLSDRALNGFIARAVAGGLRMPNGFLDALRKADRRISGRSPVSGRS